MKRSFIREILEYIDSDTISFAGGLPDVSLFPLDELQKAAQRVLENADSLQYGHSTGYAPLKEQIAKYYRDRGFPTVAENILITSGSQQGLDIICRYYSGTSIAIEKPSYLGALNIFRLNNLNRFDMPLSQDGIDSDLFRKSILQTKLAYLIPDFQNPSATCYTDKNRKEIARAIRDSQIVLIEDSPYSELYFDMPHNSISQFVPEQSYHLGSFSKMLAPSLRVGWIRADKALLSPLIAYKEAMDLHTSGISQRIISEYLKDGKSFRKHLQKLRTSYRKKMNFFCEKLDLYLPDFEYTRPRGGMFIYGKLKGVDTVKLAKICLGKGVVFVPGAEFNGASDEIRFNFTNSSFEEISEGLKRIKSSL